jgi:CheY-like chemotaxis protein/two-component sensor histidine kinase
LAPIRNGLQILRLAGPGGSAVEQARAVMERQLAQMVRLVDDLLDVSRITRNKLELRKERVELTAVVASAVETSRPLIEASGHRLSVNLPSSPVYLDADLTRLAQIFSNLLNNAAKYTEKGGRIWLTAERAGDEVLVTVKDSGIGIPPEMLPKVFDLFMQVDRTLERSQGGLGIGLTLVRRLTEMHGGSVAVASDGPGKGATLTVRLPVRRAAAAPAAGEFQRARVGSLTQATVLVVEDDRDTLALLESALRMAGATPVGASSVAEAMRVIDGVPFDALVSDIAMPGQDGYTLMTLLKDRYGAHMPAATIALTAYAGRADRDRALAAGFREHLAKPVNPDILLRTLEDLLAADATRAGD